MKIKSEREGHFAFYKDRQIIWDYIVDKRLSFICNAFEMEYTKLSEKYSSKKDGTIHKLIVWHKYLSEYTDRDTDMFCETDGTIYDESIHKCAIFRTIGKYLIV